MVRHGNKHRINVTLSTQAMRILDQCKKNLPIGTNPDRATSRLIDTAILKALTDPKEQIREEMREHYRQITLLEERLSILEEDRGEK